MQRVRKRRGLLVILVLIPFCLEVGCISSPSEAVNNETTSFNNASTPTVPPAPKQIYVKVGQVEVFDYAGYHIEVNYTTVESSNIIEVKLDENSKIFQRGPEDNPDGIYWKESNLSFAIKPVFWITRDSQSIPFYEETWNTSEIYFEVNRGRIC